MANVGFKMGTQDALDALLKLGTSANAVNGTFYLTSNTNRLYIGKEDGSIAPVNEGVITVDNVAALNNITANSGEFYYAKAENVLCVRSGNNWVQINAVVTNSSLSQTASNAADGGAALQTILVDSRGENVNQTFKVKGDGGITVTGSGDTITVTGDPLTLSTSTENNVASATFKAGGAEQTLQIAKGNDNVTVTSEDNKISISAKNTYVNKLSSLNASEGFTILGATNEGTAIEGTTINPIIKLDSASQNSTDSIKFEKGIATIPVYTVGEVNTIRDNLTKKIDDDLKAFNAMEYKGTVGTASTQRQELPVVADNVKNGYAYLVSGTLTYDGVTYPSGALVVAEGTEDASSGYLTDIKWSFVTGSTSDTTYSAFITTDGALNLQASTGGQPVAVVNVVAGNEMEVAKNAAGSGSTQVYTVNHKTYDTADYDTTGATAASVMSAVSSYEIEAITGIAVTNGHITGVTSKKYTVKDTNVKLTSTTASVSAANNVATVTHSIILSDGAGSPITSDTGNASFVVESSSLEVTTNANSNGVVMNLVWGTF